MPPDRSARRLGILCLSLALLLWALSFPLHCAGRAALVSGFSLLDGAALGAALAMVTRTRRPLAIYGWLAVAALTFWPLLVVWPPGGAFDVHPGPYAPALASNYFDVLRLGLFFLGIPYPFARCGHHAPDPQNSAK
jgi:hypothetical protein